MYKSLRLFVFVLVLVSVCSFKVKPLVSSASNTVYGWWVVAEGGGQSEGCKVKGNTGVDLQYMSF